MPTLAPIQPITSSACQQVACLYLYVYFLLELEVGASPTTDFEVYATDAQKHDTYSTRVCDHYALGLGPPIHP